MPGKKHDSSKIARHTRVEEAMEEVIGQHDSDVGPVSHDEVAALSRFIGVRSNMEGEPLTVGELVTATGIVMEEVGAKPETRTPNPNYRGKPDKEDRPRRPRGKRSYFVMGTGRRS